ncbi:MAG: hypothetical protein C0P79_001665 [Gammaproteobacteria bacterium]|nr:hypothetical protein [Gammaproteobacteria bacterium]
MILRLLASRRASQRANEQLLKLYWNRAAVKRELRDLRRERYELLDKLKEQDLAIARAKEQLEGLERLLTNPVAAANAMVYFQLRHLWNTSAERLEQFVRDLEVQREKRERAALREAALAKRGRRLDAIAAKLAELEHKSAGIADEQARLEQRLARSNFVLRLIRGPRLKRRIAQLAKGKAVLAARIDELKILIDKIEGEPLPELEGLSLDSRRLINAAAIAFAQHLVVHFAEHDLAQLAKTCTERPVGEMKFGDRAACDRMVERIRERTTALKRDNLAEAVRRRTEMLMPQLRYRDENDSVPLVECVDEIPVIGNEATRRGSDAPLRLNVLAEDYWELLTVLR